MFDFPVNEMIKSSQIHKQHEHVSDVASSGEACSDEFKVSKGSNKKWNEKEERICLWDTFDDEYTLY